MGVYIKGIEMPATCCHCPLMGYDTDIEWNDGGRDARGAYICVLTHELIDNTKREEHCPLVSVPSHGRLIDGDALLSRFEKEEKACDEHGREFSFSFISANEYCTEWWAVQRFLMDEMDAKTIIPAEEGG